MTITNTYTVPEFKPKKKGIMKDIPNLVKGADENIDICIGPKYKNGDMKDTSIRKIKGNGADDEMQAIDPPLSEEDKERLMRQVIKSKPKSNKLPNFKFESFTPTTPRKIKRIIIEYDDFRMNISEYQGESPCNMPYEDFIKFNISDMIEGTSLKLRGEFTLNFDQSIQSIKDAFTNFYKNLGYPRSCWDNLKVPVKDHYLENIICSQCKKQHLGRYFLVSTDEGDVIECSSCYNKIMKPRDTSETVDEKVKSNEDYGIGMRSEDSYILFFYIKGKIVFRGQYPKEMKLCEIMELNSDKLPNGWNYISSVGERKIRSDYNLSELGISHNSHLMINTQKDLDEKIPLEFIIDGQPIIQEWDSFRDLKDIRYHILFVLSGVEKKYHNCYEAFSKSGERLELDVPIKDMKLNPHDKIWLSKGAGYGG